MPIITWLSAVLLISLGGVTERILHTNEDFYLTYLPLTEVNSASKFFHEDSVRPLIKDFKSAATVRGHPELKLSKRKFLMTLFAPQKSYFNDVLYLLMIAFISIFILFRIKRIDTEKPFSMEIVSGFQWVGYILFFFTFLSFLRHKLINNTVGDLTDNLYKLERFSLVYQVEFWLGIFIVWLYRIMKKGEALQKEQDLTV